MSIKKENNSRAQPNVESAYPQLIPTGIGLGEVLQRTRGIVAMLENRFFGYGFTRQPLSDVFVDTATSEGRWCAVDTVQRLFGAPKLIEENIPEYILEKLRTFGRSKLEEYERFKREHESSSWDGNPEYFRRLAMWQRGSSYTIASSSKDLYQIIADDFSPYAKQAKEELNNLVEAEKNNPDITDQVNESLTIVGAMKTVIDFYCLEPSGVWACV